MPKIKVYPTQENSFILVHPRDGAISDAGSMWEDDAFTARMITDNAVSTDPARCHKFAPDKKRDYSQPPAHATGSGVVKPKQNPVTAQMPAATPADAKGK